MRGETTCSGGMSVTVSVEFDEVEYPDTAGLRVRLSYPTAAVSIPGSKSSEQVNSRVTNLTPLRADQEDPEALFAAADVDTDGDGRDDQVVIGLVTRSEPIRSGPLARVNFDCVTGESVPPAGAFHCTTTASTRDGSSLRDVSCSVSVEGPSGATSNPSPRKRMDARGAPVSPSSGSPQSTSRRSSNM
jgi:hypothetical protein